MTTFPIPQFVRIEANQTTDAMNELIVELNELIVSLTSGIVIGAPNIISRRQLFTALQGVGLLDTVHNAVPADPTTNLAPYGLVWVDYWASTTVILGSGLSNFIRDTIGYTDLQMAALFLTATGYPI